LAHAERVDAALDRVTGAEECVAADRLPGRRLGLEDHLQAALEVEPLMDGDAVALPVEGVEYPVGEVNPDRAQREQDDEDQRETRFDPHGENSSSLGTAVRPRHSMHSSVSPPDRRALRII